MNVFCDGFNSLSVFMVFDYLDVDKKAK